MKCPNCGAENTGKFCSECGFLLVEQECRNCHTLFFGRTCPNCGETVPLFPKGTPVLLNSPLTDPQEKNPDRSNSSPERAEAAPQDSLPPDSDTPPEPPTLLTEEALSPASDQSNPAATDSLNLPTGKLEPAVQENLSSLEDVDGLEDLDDLDDSPDPAAPLEQEGRKKARSLVWLIPLCVFLLLFLFALFFSGQFASSLLIVSMASALVYLTMTIVRSCQQERFMLPDFICCLISFLVFFLTLYL